jgi:purine nucleosidase
MTRKIIIDTDPGQDDAVAILAALASPDELDVLGLTSVAGNVPIGYTTRNCLMLVELAARTDVKVYQGSPGPLARELVTAEHVHGATGIDGIGRPEPTISIEPQSAVDFMAEALQHNDDVTLCTLGPLTNIAHLLEQRPDLASRVTEIVMMGGGHFAGGNVTPSAEFNIYVDPQAAAKVFTSGIPLVLMPLDVTHQAISTPERIAAFRALGNEAGTAVAGMLDFYTPADPERYPEPGSPLHDPTVIAYLLEPGLFRGRHVNVAIETESELTMGTTVVDWWKATKRPANCLVMGAVEADGFYRLLADRIGRLG